MDSGRAGEHSGAVTLSFARSDRGHSIPHARRARGANRIATMRTSRDLTDSQWATLDPLIPEPSGRKDGRGRPWKDRRAVLNGILWVLRTGAPWADLPDRYHRIKLAIDASNSGGSGILKGIFEALAADLRSRGSLDLREGSSMAASPRPKRGLRSREDEAW